MFFSVYCNLGIQHNETKRKAAIEVDQSYAIEAAQPDSCQLMHSRAYSSNFQVASSNLTANKRAATGGRARSNQMF